MLDDLAIEAERLRIDGANFRVHRFARQVGITLSLIATIGAKRGLLKAEPERWLPLLGSPQLDRHHSC
jgi:hypothetical protein